MINASFFEVEAVKWHMCNEWFHFGIKMVDK